MIYHFFNLRAIKLLRVLILASFIFVINLNAYALIKDHYVAKILKFEINSSINPGTLKYFEHNLNKYHDSDLVFIKMNTPGGLLSTTKSIINTLVESQIPYLIWVGPSGSSATSAGAIIASSANFLIMSEGSNIGAATPIQTNGDIKKDSDMRAKAVNDIKALVKSQAELHNRASKPFEEMIERARSFSAEESLRLKFIDSIQNSQEDVLNFVDNKETKTGAKKLKILLTKKTNIITADMDLGLKLLNILSSPNLAYILFLLGAALIYLELQSPGGMIAGALGVVFLVISGISFQVLPLNVGALGLIIMAFVLFILEVYITSFGILSLGGLASLITGSLFLFRTNDSYISISKSIILSTSAAIATFIGIIAYIFIKSKNEIGKSHFNDQTGKEGLIIDIIDGLLIVKSQGEIWRATSDDNLHIGDKVLMHNKNTNMTYKISKIPKEEI